jgi:hypothetical protein
MIQACYRAEAKCEVTKSPRRSRPRVQAFGGTAELIGPLFIDDEIMEDVTKVVLPRYSGEKAL